MRWVLTLVGLVAGLGCGAAYAQAPPAPNPSVEAFKAICLKARAEPGATAKAALEAHWSPIPAIAIPAMGGTAFQDAVGYRAPSGDLAAARQVGASAQGLWVIIGRTPMPGFAYLADSCAVFAAPADPFLAAAVRAGPAAPPPWTTPASS